MVLPFGHRHKLAEGSYPRASPGEELYPAVTGRAGRGWWPIAHGRAPGSEGPPVRVPARAGGRGGSLWGSGPSF
jgi:hypothetical protein